MSEPLDDLKIQTVLVHHMIEDIMAARSQTFVNPDAFSEGWIKAHVYGVDEEYIATLQTVFSKTYINIVHQLRE